MKEQIKQIIAESPDKLRSRNLVREYLQVRILQFLQESGAFLSWIFHGGTALRLLYRLPRYSEDLDFALKDSPAALDLKKVAARLSKEFQAEAYKVDLKLSERKAVKSVFIRFPGLLYELGISAHQKESLAIRIEIDTNPPSGGETETSLIRRYVMLNLLHYDKSSLLAGKLHAILARPYVKGRDLYDLLWYLSDTTWPGPNIKFLNEALRQTKWKGNKINESNWAHILAEKLERIDWPRAVEDVRPFIERISDIDLLTKENILKLLKLRFYSRND